MICNYCNKEISGNWASMLVHQVKMHPPDYTIHIPNSDHIPGYKEALAKFAKEKSIVFRDELPEQVPENNSAGQVK